MNVSSNENIELPNTLILERSTGTLSGYVERQAESSHGGVQLVFNPGGTSNWERVAPNFTTLTYDSGRFESNDMWTGNYEIYAQSDGYARVFGRIYCSAKFGNCDQRGV